MNAVQHDRLGKAQVFAKYGSTQWARVAEYPVERHLLEK